MDMDLALDGVDVGDGGEIEVAAPDEGLQTLQEGAGPFEIAGAGPRLDVGRALPVLADRLIVLQRRLDRHGGGRGGRIGPQAQVDAEDIAVRRALLQQAGQRLGQPRGEGLRLHARRQRQGRRLVEDRDVDVAGIV